jgi:uncharacterized protein (DUF427 family)
LDYSVRLGDEALQDVAWAYPFPDRELSGTNDLAAFFSDRPTEPFVTRETLPRARTAASCW